ncbi:MAG: hypothetical protein GX605_07980, partial [Chloroflexi bacterium]|nr:hypothetical protein [Chloroflexota bacterium]
HPRDAPPPSPDTYLSDSLDAGEGPGRTHVAVSGTQWKPEIPNQWSPFRPYGFGMQLRKKAVGGHWVHLGIPLLTQLNGTAQKISQVEFCAKSSNGVVTTPTPIHFWDNDTRFRIQTIAWPADNNYHCVAVPFNPPVWKQALNISVYLHFNSVADSIFLYKGWVLLVD